MSKGSSQSSQQSQTSSWTPTALPQMQDLYSRILNTSNTPYAPYDPNALVAPINANQQTGINTVMNAPSAQPYINQAQQYATQGAGPISQSSIERYYNPFQSSVIDATLANMQEQNTLQEQQLRGNSTAMGGLANSRFNAVALPELYRQQKLSDNPTLAGLNVQNYTQALAAAQADRAAAAQGASTFSNLGTTAQGAGQQLGQGQITAGGVQQQNAQQLANAKYQEFMRQQGYPFQTTQFAAGLGLPTLQAQGGIGTGTSTGTQTSTPSGLGTGLGLLSLFAQDGGRIGYAQGGDVSPYAPWLNPDPIPMLSNIPSIEAPKALNNPGMPHGMSPASSGSAGSPNSLGNLSSLKGLGTKLNNAFKAPFDTQNNQPNDPNGWNDTNSGGSDMASSQGWDEGGFSDLGGADFGGGYALGGSPYETDRLGYVPDIHAPQASNVGPMNFSALQFMKPDNGLNFGALKGLFSGTGGGSPDSADPDGNAFQPPPQLSPAINPQINQGNNPETISAIRDELKNQGWSDNAIQAALHGAKQETNFNYANSHFDQPRYRGQMSPGGNKMENSYGLWQHGGPNVPPLERFLAQNNSSMPDFMKNPRLQAQFLNWDMRNNNAKAFSTVNNANTPEDAALGFLNYLNPAERFKRQRAAQISQGIPRYDDGGGVGSLLSMAHQIKSAISPVSGFASGGETDWEGGDFGTKDQWEDFKKQPRAYTAWRGPLEKLFDKGDVPGFRGDPWMRAWDYTQQKLGLQTQPPMSELLNRAEVPIDMEQDPRHINYKSPEQRIAELAPKPGMPFVPVPEAKPPVLAPTAGHEDFNKNIYAPAGKPMPPRRQMAPAGPIAPRGWTGQDQERWFQRASAENPFAVAPPQPQARMQAPAADEDTQSNGSVDLSQHQDNRDKQGGERRGWSPFNNEGSGLGHKLAVAAAIYGVNAPLQDRHQRQALDIKNAQAQLQAERLYNAATRENYTLLGTTADGSPLLFDRRSGKSINAITGQPITPDTKVTTVGRGGNTPAQISVANALVAAREQRRETNPDLPPLDMEEALKLAKKSPADLELEASRNAAREAQTLKGMNKDFKSLIEEHRQLLGLPPRNIPGVTPQSAPPPAGQLPIVRTQADYDKLKVGGPFMTPSGATRRKTE